MTSAFGAWFVVLLLLPGTSLRDWQQGGPHLRRMMQTGATALMNARTAEVDRITPLAGCYTIGAGARMRASTDANGLGYPARADNLAATLDRFGCRCRANDRLAQAVLGDRGASAGNATGPEFLVEDLGSNTAAADARIAHWEQWSNTTGAIVMIVSPSPSVRAYAAYDRLTPVLLWQGRPDTGGASAVPAGLLYSPSTHRAGLIANTDIAATIPALLGHPGLVGPHNGESLRVQPDASAERISRLTALEARLTGQERMLAARPYIAAVLALLLAAAALLALTGRLAPGPLAVFAVSVPLAMSLAPSPVLYGVLLILFAAASFLRRGDALWRVRMICGITVAVMLVDAVFFHGAVTAGSLLGYSPIEGARYYGIGNEVMGALLGASVISAGWIMSRWSAVPAVLLLVLVTVTLGHPLAGAKAGGFLAGGLSAVAFAWGASGRRFRPLTAIAVAVGCIAAGVAGLALLGRFGHSHVTQALGDVHRGGGSALISILLRKVAMDLHLVFHSVWLWVLIAAIGGASLLMRGSRLDDPVSRATVVGGVSATAACLALNDAGVVAAAICALYTWSMCAVLGASAPDDRIRERA